MPLDRLRSRERELAEALAGGSEEAREATRLLRGSEEAALPALARASGIDDEALLRRVAGLGIRADTLAALTAVPLIEVAWADGVLDPRERRAVLDGAVATGVEEGSPSHTLLRLWTEERPSPALFKLWRELVSALCAELEPGEVRRFGQKLFARARAVAEAAGSGFDFGNNISRVEAAVLEELEQAFRATRS